MRAWKPNVTVAAVIRQDDRFLLVEEEVAEGLCLNNPAGHLEPGESLVEAVVRETLEETAYRFEPRSLVGVYMNRSWSGEMQDDVTWMRFAFEGRVSDHDPQHVLDTGIVRALWMTLEEVRAERHRHRSPMVLRSIEDLLAGRRFPLDLVHTHASIHLGPEAGS